jgi:hypothetical protein
MAPIIFAQDMTSTDCKECMGLLFASTLTIYTNAISHATRNP